MRNNELLPAPLGPVKTKAWPAATEKLTLENTRRPPRMQAKSRPDSFIATISLTSASPRPPYPPPRAGRAIAYDAALLNSRLRLGREMRVPPHMRLRGLVARARGIRAAGALFFPAKACSRLSFIWQNHERVRITTLRRVMGDDPQKPRPSGHPHSMPSEYRPPRPPERKLA